MNTAILPSKSRTTHAAHSDPEAASSSAPVASIKLLPKRAATYWEIDTALREQLASYKDVEGLSNIALGKRLSMADGTVVSKYLNARMDRDPSDFENRVRDLLAAHDRRREYGGSIVPTNVVQKIAIFIDRVRQTERVGVFTGEAGIGKTTGIHAYVVENPTSLFITINAIQNDANGVKQLLWAASNPPAKCREAHFTFLVKKYKGSRIPIIVDSAQRLGSGGRQFLYDFHDATGCPIILVGNPVILEQVARNDQEHSRTARDASAELKDPGKVVRALISQHLSDPEEIMDLALAVVTRERGGHLRTLGHLLAEMRVLMELPKNEDRPRACFEMALAASVNFKDLAA